MYYRLPVNVGFVTLAIRDERADVTSYLDLDTGGVFTLPLGEDGEPLDEGLGCRLRHALWEHPERFITIDPLTDLEKRIFIAEFAGGLTDEYLRRRLRKASEAEAPLDACDEILRPYSELRGLWHERLARFLLSAVRELLRENAIEPQIIPNDIYPQLINLCGRF